MRSDRAQCPSRDEEVAHLWLALESVFGIDGMCMLDAVEAPTLGDFLARIRRGGTIRYLLGGFGKAKLAVELSWLDLIPFEETVPGGPGYRKELTDVLIAIGVLRPGARAHRVHLDQLGEAIAAAWCGRAAAHLEELLAVRPPTDAGSLAVLRHQLAGRFAGALRWQLVRDVLHREVEGLSCEGRRWRTGFLAHDCVLRPDGGGLYRPRCHRRGDRRPEAAQPSAETWAAGEVAVPQLEVLAAGADSSGGRRFRMDRKPLAELFAL